MSKIIVAVADSPFPSLDPVKEALAPLDPEIRLSASASPQDILAVAADADAVIVCYAKLTAEVIGGFNRCRVIGRTGLGVDNIDLPTARAKKITVTYVPDYCIAEVSDHAMALLLAMARKVPLANEKVQSGRWVMGDVVPLHRLSGCVVGLVGFGNIPRALVPKAKAFGFKVVAYDPFLDQKAFEAAGITGVSFDELLAVSDFVSVHAPLTPQTRGLFNDAAFAKMKEGAVIVNTARGPLIDEKALLKALDSGRLGGAALDVVEVEPLPAGSPLHGRSNLILTPHTGFYSIEALRELQSKAASDVLHVLRGEPPVYPIG